MTMAEFDPTGPLPTGTTVLEASAGTGKTWTIGALVARYVAEGLVRLDQMLVITFTRAASQELRSRVRGQLVELASALTDPAAARPDNVVVDALVAVDDLERAVRLARVRAALAGFDEATIATTHEFCAIVLRSLGVAGDSDAGARLVEDLEAMTVEVVDDLYLRSLRPDALPEFTYSQARQMARDVVSDAQARIEPADAAGSVGPDGRPHPVGRRVRFATVVRQEMEARKRAAGVLSYDDLLTQLAGALQAPDSLARDRMRQRWQVVLVDEFQDTDPVQWEVLDRAFSGHATMVLIGDPKQAIYAFRGGDVVSYLSAAGTAQTRQTLAVNRRSDQPLLARLQHVLSGAQLGDPEITVHPVRAHHQQSRLEGVPHADPLRLRLVTRAHLGISGGKRPTVGPVREHIARDLAADVRELLSSGAQFDGRPLRPADVAVLAATNAVLRTVQQALRDVGVPAVIGGGGSVFGTPAAVEWLTVLEALGQPHRSDRVRAAALTSFVGLTSTTLDAGSDGSSHRDESRPGRDRLTDRLSQQLATWAEIAERRGVISVLEAALIDGAWARTLAETDGERRLTDLRQVGQLLQDQGATQRWGLVALADWLREQIRDSRVATGARDVGTRRLDSDAEAVQLVTIHASKGLEFPIVYLPSLSDRYVPRDSNAVLRYHDASGTRCRDIGGSQWPGRAEREAQHRSEEAGEQLRLLYVAMTRAMSQVVLWWAPSNNATGAPLHRMLFGRGAGEGPVPDTAPVAHEARSREVLEQWAVGGGVHLEPADIADVPTAPVSPPSSELHVRTFDRTVDTTWRRTSYTALSRPLEQAQSRRPTVGSEPERMAKQDELPISWPGVDDGTGPPPPSDARVLAGDRPSPMAGLPVGATFGSLVHAVLEHADPRATDLRAELLAQIGPAVVDWPVDLDHGELADALVQVISSPLGPLTDGATLAQIGTGDRLSELAFELPLSAGDLAPRRTTPARVQLGDLSPLLRTHLPADDPVRGYADLLDAVPELADQDLRGYLTGSVDVVLRTGGRYLVVDYKTNWLGPTDRPLTAAAYAPSELAAAMRHSDYPLQALLYAVVLHRFLRWRLAGYRPEDHLGGVLYLYLRGMCGPDTPVVDGHPCGVFSWRPPVALVEQLSQLLDGQVSGVGGAA